MIHNDYIKEYTPQQIPWQDYPLRIDVSAMDIRMPIYFILLCWALMWFVINTIPPSFCDFGNEGKHLLFSALFIMSLFAVFYLWRVIIFYRNKWPWFAAGEKGLLASYGEHFLFVPFKGMTKVEVARGTIRKYFYYLRFLYADDSHFILRQRAFLSARKCRRIAEKCNGFIKPHAQ